MNPSPTPRIDVLEALLRVYTLEQLVFIAERSREAVERTGWGQVVLVFERGKFEKLTQANNFTAPEAVAPKESL